MCTSTERSNDAHSSPRASAAGAELNGTAFGIELCPQFVCGAATFIGYFGGTVDGQAGSGETAGPMGRVRSSSPSASQALSSTREPRPTGAGRGAAVAPAADTGEVPQLDLDITGSAGPAPAAEQAAAPEGPANEVTTEISPPPPPPEPGQSAFTKQPRAQAN